MQWQEFLEKGVNQNQERANFCQTHSQPVHSLKHEGEELNTKKASSASEKVKYVVIIKVRASIFGRKKAVSHNLY